jgi:hypothetical protein
MAIVNLPFLTNNGSSEMTNTTRSDIRNIFLSDRQSCALMTASLLLGMTLKELKKDIEDGVIVAVSTRLGQRIAREELIAVAMQKWDQATIEEALGEDAAAVLPEAIRLVELQARIPRYQRDMLRWSARRDETTVDAVLSRELEDVACAHAEELAAAVPGFEAALGWS